MGAAGVAIQHHQVAVQFGGFFLQPHSHFAADAGAAVILGDDDIVDVELAAAPEAHADPEAAATHEFLAIERRQHAVAERQHFLQRAVEQRFGHPRIQLADKRVDGGNFGGRQFA